MNQFFKISLRITLAIALFLPNVNAFGICTATISPSGTVSICQGSKLILNATPNGVGYSFQWLRNGSPISGTSSSLTVNKSGAYKVTITDPFGCIVTSMATNVMVVPKPNAAVSSSGNFNLCPIGEVEVLTANAGVGFTYQWIKNGSNIIGATNQSYSVSQVGAYKVRVFNASGCPKTSVSYTITKGCTIPCEGLPIEFSDNLIAYYPFCNNANDMSGNLGNSCVFNNAVSVADRFGNSSSAYWFNGIDSYMAANADNFPATGPRSVVFYFNLDDPLDHNGVLGWGGGECGTSYIVSMNQTDLPNSYRTQGHCVVNSANTSNSYPPPAGWNQFTLTSGYDTTRMYLNGTLIEDFPGIDAENTNVFGKDFIIGAVPSPSGIDTFTDVNVKMFSGYLDDIIIYNDVLTAEKVASLYNYFTTGEKIALAPSGEQQLLISPNPNSGNVLHVNYALSAASEKEVKVNIFDVLGNAILTTLLPVENGIIDETINLGNIPGGIYFLFIDEQDSQNTSTFIVNK